MVPAIGFGYLSQLLDLMSRLDIVSQMVLLLDEFEDVQSLSRVGRNEHLMAVKGMVNAFNWRRLFLVVAGQRAAFTTLGQHIPSLQDRWERVSLQPLGSSAQAVELAEAYEAYSHAEWCVANNEHRWPELEPSSVEVKALYADLTNEEPVTPRALLHSLHQWIEKKV